MISNAFVNEMYDCNGDYFFDAPISFIAQNSHYRTLGFGRTTTYYVIGVNFNRV